jgi:Cu+-exporting ATPase
MPTGDHRQRAAVVAELCGIPFEAELLPDEKLARLHCWRRKGHHVAMVGDGVNDAPALAAADVGVALGAGVTVARDVAGVCLLHADLSAVPWAIRLARRTVRVMRRNLWWAFGYNTVGVGLAAAGWLNPIVAAIAMIGSSLLVVIESLRLGAAANKDEPTSQQIAGRDDADARYPDRSPMWEEAAV